MLGDARRRHGGLGGEPPGRRRGERAVRALRQRPRGRAAVGRLAGRLASGGAGARGRRGPPGDGGHRDRRPALRDGGRGRPTCPRTVPWPRRSPGPDAAPGGRPLVEPSTATTGGPDRRADDPAGHLRGDGDGRAVRRGGVVGTDFAVDVTFTWVLRPDGTFLETQEPDYPDQGPQQGRYVVDGDQLLMTYGPDGSASRAGALELLRRHAHLHGDRGRGSWRRPALREPWHKID